MKTVTLELTIEAINAILETLGNLPTKSGAFPLMVDIKKQADAQLQDQSQEQAA
jgi:hypothetical protein